MAKTSPKVFGIGLNKTGTRSLAAALRILGYRTLHKGDAATSALVERAVDESMPLLSYIGEKFDAYFDVRALVEQFPLADEQYPGSKFILSTSALEPWLDSREAHTLGKAEVRGTTAAVDRAAWTAEYHWHHDRVRSYFRGRPSDLLEFDVRAGNGWKELAAFLGRSEPRSPFPRENVGGLGTYRPVPSSRSISPAIQRVSRRVARRVADRTRRQS